MKTLAKNGLNKTVWFWSNLHRCCHINTSLVEKITGFASSWAWNRILCCFFCVGEYCRRIAPSYFDDMFAPSVNKYNTSLQMASGESQRKANLGKKFIYSLVKSMIQNPSVKKVTTWFIHWSINSCLHSCVFERTNKI